MVEGAGHASFEDLVDAEEGTRTSSLDWLSFYGLAPCPWVMHVSFRLTPRDAGGAVLASQGCMDEHKHLFPTPSGELSRKREELAPAIEHAFRELGRAVFAAGALDVKTKQLIAVATAHVTQCPYCIRGHTKAAMRAGATERELMEAIWVAAEMRAGAAFAHSVIALDAMKAEMNA